MLTRHQCAKAHVAGNHHCTWQTISKADNFPKVNSYFLMDSNVHMTFVKGKGCNVNEPSVRLSVAVWYIAIKRTSLRRSNVQT